MADYKILAEMSEAFLLQHKEEFNREWIRLRFATARQATNEMNANEHE